MLAFAQHWDAYHDHGNGCTGLGCEYTEGMPQAPLSEQLVNMLACPVCRGDLAVAGEGVHCVVCKRVYPLIDGIPVLIADRASKPAS